MNTSVLIGAVTPEIRTLSSHETLSALLLREHPHPLRSLLQDYPTRRLWVSSLSTCTCIYMYMHLSTLSWERSACLKHLYTRIQHAQLDVYILAVIWCQYDCKNRLARKVEWTNVVEHTNTCGFICTYTCTCRWHTCTFLAVCVRAECYSPCDQYQNALSDAVEMTGGKQSQHCECLNCTCMLKLGSSLLAQQMNSTRGRYTCTL